MATTKSGDELVQEGERALKRFSWFGISAEGNYYDAAEAFKSAGKAFMLQKQWEAGADILIRAATIYSTKLNSPHDAVSALVDASTCLKKVDKNRAVETLQQAAGILANMGRFSQAGKRESEVAAMFEEDNNYEKAVESYRRAVEFLEMDNSPQQANQFKVKLATILSQQLSNYSDAGNIFEELGKSSIDNRLLKFHAKGYFLQALLCFLAMGDQVKAERKLQEFFTLDYDFPASREGKFISSIVEAVRNYDSQTFTDVCAEFDSVSRMDPWKVSILLEIKKSISEVAEADLNRANDDEVDLT